MHFGLARSLAGEVVPLEASAAGEGKLGFILRVPIGVVGIIFESRPNVTADAGALPGVGRQMLWTYSTSPWVVALTR